MKDLILKLIEKYENNENNLYKSDEIEYKKISIICENIKDFQSIEIKLKQENIKIDYKFKNIINKNLKKIINFNDKFNTLDQLSTNDKNSIIENIREYFKEESTNKKLIIKCLIYNLLKKYNIKNKTIINNMNCKSFFIELLDLNLVSNNSYFIKEDTNINENNLELDMLKEIFSNMNNSSNSYILDNIAKNELQLSQLKKSKFEIPLELESIVITNKLMSKFLKKIGIHQIYKIGSILQLTLEETQNYIYHGTEFINSNDIKQVTIESPGWKINEIIISKPIVKEVICHE